MGTNELEELAARVAADLVRAKALGEEGVVASLQMAFDELLGRLADEHEGLAQVNSEPGEVRG